MKLLKFIALLLAFTTHAQKYELGKVSIRELEEKSHPLDNSAPAAVLFKKGKTHFTVDGSGEWSAITEIQYRIKIYKKEGYEWANRELTFYTGGMNIKANFSDAVTYNLVNGKIEETKLKGDGEFREKMDEEYSRKKITMPNVREGSIIEFTEKVDTPYLTTLRDFDFQYSIPVNYVEYDIAIPVYFSYDRYTTGFVKLEHNEATYRHGSSGVFQERAVKYWANNVKALKEEPYVSNIDNYRSSIKHELAMTHFPSGDKKYSADWPAMAKRIYAHEDFGKELDNENYFKEDLQLIMNPSLSVDDQMTAIFNYVKNRMAWDGDTSYFCEKGVKKAYEDKTGNVAEINLMLTAMLRSAGFKAHPVLISTRSNGVALFPALNAYNYVVAGVETAKGVVVLDATSKYTCPGQLPMRAMNWIGRMIRKHGTTAEVDLSQKKTSRENINVAAKLGADGSVSGTVRDQSHDYLAYNYRENYSNLSTDSYVEKLEKDFNGLEISDYKAEGKADLVKPVLEAFSFRHNAIADVIGDKIYFSPMLFYTMNENPFKAETRDYPIDFVFPYQYRYLMNITVPEGYAVESLPEPLALAMAENIGTFRYSVGQNNGILQVAVQYDVNEPIVSQEYYRTLKDFFQKMIEKQNEKVILKKV